MITFTEKTYSNRSNANRAVAKFREQHPDSAVQFALTTAGDGKIKILEPVAILAEAETARAALSDEEWNARDDAEAGPESDAPVDAEAVDPIVASYIAMGGTISTEASRKAAKDAEREALRIAKAEARAERKIAAAAAQAEVAKIKAERKAAQVEAKAVVAENGGDVTAATLLKATDKAAKKAAAKAKADAKSLAIQAKIDQGRADRKARAEAKAAETAGRKAKAKSPLGDVRADGLREGTAFAKMVDAVLRPEGASYPELLDVTGWKQCRPMLVKGCEKANVALTLDRSVKPARYHGVYRAAA